MIDEEAARAAFEAFERSLGPSHPDDCACRDRSWFDLSAYERAAWDAAALAVADEVAERMNP